MDAEGEHQQRDAKLGDRPHPLDVLHDAQDVGPKDDATKQVSEDDRLAQAKSDRPSNQGREKRED